MAARRDLVILSAAVAVSALAIPLMRVAPSEVPTDERLAPAAAVAAARAARARFGPGQDIALVALWTPRVERVAAIERSVAAVAGVVWTMSAASRPRLALAAADPPRLELLRGGRTPPSALGRLLQPAPGAWLIVAGLDPGVTRLDAARGFATALERAVRGALAPGERVAITGTPEVRALSWDEAAREPGRILPFMIPALVVVPGVVFGSALAAVFPLVLAGLTCALVLLAHRALAGPLDPFILLLVPFLWALATLDALHVYHRARRHTAARVTDPVRRAVRELRAPCLVTSLATVASLLAFAVTGGSRLLVAVGLWGALGALVAHLLTFTMGGALLRLSLRPAPPPAWPARAVARAFALARRRAGLIVAATVVALAVLALAPGTLAIEHDGPDPYGSRRAAGAPARAIAALLHTDLAPVEIDLEPDGRAAPERLLMAALIVHDYLSRIPETSHVLSVAPLVVELARAEPRARALIARPDLRAALAAQARALSRDPRIAAWLDVETGRARFQVLFAPMTFGRRRQIFGWLRHLDETVLRHYHLRFGGPGYLYHVAEANAAHGVAWGLAASAATLALLFGVALRGRSPTLVAIAVAVNVVPVVLVAGVMRVAHVPWSLGLLALPQLLLAVAADDTVHWMWPLGRAGARTGAVLPAVARDSGAPILATSLVIAGAMLSLERSAFQANRALGALMVAGVAAALACDLLVGPALVALTERWRRSA